MNFIKEQIINLLELIHLRIFGQPLSQQMKNFLVNLGWSFLGGGIYALIMLALNIAAGRLIGPSEYGTYNLIFTLSSFIIIFIMFGLDVESIRAIATSKNNTEKKQNIGSTCAFVLSGLVIFCLLTLGLCKIISSKFSLDPKILLTTLFLTIILVLKPLFDNFARGLHLFKLQFKAKMLEISFDIIAFILIFYFLKTRIYSSYAYTLIAGASMLVIFYIVRLPIRNLQFNWITLKKQLSASKLFFITTLFGTTFASLDKLFIGKYLSIYQLGIYSAYYMASFTLVTQITQMVINVLLPTAAKIEDKSFIKKINHVFRIGFIPLFFLMFLLSFLVIKLYGNKYGINYYYIFLFTILSCLQIFQIIYNSIILTFNKKLYKKYIIYLNTFNLLTILGYPIMIITKSISIDFILALLIFNMILVLLLQRKIISLNLSEQRLTISAQ